MFRILVVDDDSGARQLVREMMKNVHRPCELHFAESGAEALDFLHCRDKHADAPRPNLILLDMTMPGLSGLQTLSAIKTDPELCIIPVVMLSTVSSPKEVRNCYQAHANCYVLKPTNLERSVKFVEAVEAFWMDFALLPTCEERTAALQPPDSKGQEMPTETLPAGDLHTGTAIAAATPEEATSQAMRVEDLPAKDTITLSPIMGCEEHNRLLNGFGEAVEELLTLHDQQFRAIVSGDTESHRFDLLIHMANEKKLQAKYAYLLHAERHGCTDPDALN